MPSAAWVFALAVFVTLALPFASAQLDDDDDDVIPMPLLRIGGANHGMPRFVPPYAPRLLVGW